MKLRYFARFVAIAIAGLSGTAAADDMFLKFVGNPAVGEIRGDSTDPQHPDEIVVLSYALGITADSSWSKGAVHPSGSRIRASSTSSTATTLRSRRW